MTLQHKLTIENLTYIKNGRALLDNVSLAVEPGEIVGIIGPNGAGKSTLLKNIIGFYTASSGSITIHGKPLKLMSHHERALEISYLAQHSEISFPFSVSETIALGMQNRQMLDMENRETIKSQIETITRDLEISELLNRNLTELSGGETQLVHFARIYSQKAPIMLLDEPTASLDIGHEAQLMNILRRHCKQHKSAVVALHNLNTAATFCDRLLLMHHGKLISSGTPTQVLTPENMTNLYGHQVIVSEHPITGTKIILPVKTG